MRERTYTLVGCTPMLRPGWFVTNKLLSGVREPDLHLAVSNFFDNNPQLIAIGLWSEDNVGWAGGVRRI